MRNGFLASGALASTLLLVGCAGDDPMKRVEQEVSDLKIEVFKLRQEMENANKRAEAERVATQEARSQEGRFRADLQENLRQLQDATRILYNRMGEQPSSRRPAGKPAADPTTPAVPMAEEEKTFNAGVLDYNRGNYALSAEALEAFLKAYPSSTRRPDALFFLGLSHYNQKAYDKAKGVFEQILKDHSSSNQFLPARLKRAQCLLKLGLKPSAVKAFKELVEGFPGTPEARTAKQELEDLGL